MAQGYTLEQLQKMGAKPVQTGQGFTLEQLKQMQSGQTGGPTQGGFMGGVKKVVGGITNFLTGSEQGTAKDIAAGFGAQQYSPQEASMNAKSVSQLISHAHQLPVGDPRRSQLLQTASQIAGIGSGQASENLANIPSTGKAALDVAGVAGDILSAGTYGKATAGMKSFEMASKAPTAVTLAGKGIEKVGQKLEERAAEKATGTALEAVTRSAKDITPTEYQDLLKKGLVEAKSATGGATVKLTEQETKLAEQFKGLLQSGDPVKNIDNIMGEITKQDTEVGKYLAGKKIIYNTGELKNALLDSVKNISDVMVPSQKVLGKAKEDLVNTIIGGLKQNDLESLWKSRKSFDQLIESRMNAFAGSPTLKKDIAKGIRNAAQQFITDHLGNDTYAKAMKDMRGLFDLADLVGEKATKERGLNALQSWAKNNPGKATALKWAVYITGAERALKSFGAPVP